MSGRQAMRFLAAVVLLASGQRAWADLKVAPVFGSHMVLQQGMKVPVWGTADPGEKITVKFQDQESPTTADDKGRWMVKLDSMKAAPKQKGTTLVVVGQKKTVTFTDVLLGEVWLCSGQSNMQWNMGQSDAEDDITSADLPDIRHRGNGGTWTVCSPKSVPGFTAVGFYFARKVHKETGLPIGLLDNAIGGTAIEPWLAPGSYEKVAELRPMLDAQQARVEQYNKQIGLHLDKIEKWVKTTRQVLEAKKDAPPPPVFPLYPVSPFTMLYRGFTEPLRPYAVRGMLWYQGESNGNEGDIYFHKMKALIDGQRKAWDQGDFSVYVVQLPQIGGISTNPEGGDGWSRIRVAQSKCLTIPNTGVAVTIDIGDPTDIHPRNKKDVGERLALWALAKDYGKKDLVYSGPTYKGMKVEGDKARLSFDHVGGGLMVGTKAGKKLTQEAKDGKLQRFAVAGADGKWFWAEATIEGADVIVSSQNVKEPVAVRYAYQNNPAGANLYNREGLPASPFRTDDGKPLASPKKPGK